MTSGLAAAMRRFRGHSGEWRLTAAGGLLAHTPDNYPVCDWVGEDVYAIVDSGHGFKTLAIGRLAAAEIAGAPDPRLEPFRAGPLRARRAAGRVEGAVPVDVS